MKSKHLLLMLLIALLAPWAANGQDLADYTFTTGQDQSQWITLSDGATSIVASGDDSYSSLTDIGFSFPFGDGTYTQFWANANGVFSFSNTPADDYSVAFGSSKYTSSQPKICGITRDLGLPSTGYVKYELTGTAPNRVLVCEFYLKSTSGSSGTPTVNFQVQLHESDSKVVLVYGASASVSSFQIGLSQSSSDIWTVNPTTHEATHATGSVSTTYSAWPGEYRYYEFTRPVIACPKPSGLTATLTPGNGSIATLSWTENGEAGKWLLQYSTDETFTDNVVEIANGFNVDGSTVSANLTGLTAETQYYARVKSICDEESDWCSTVCQFKPTNAYTFFVNETATNYLYYIPFYYSTYSYSNIKSQFIVPSTALVDAQWGTINKLTFYYNTATSNYGTSNFSVYVTEVDNTTMTSMAEWATMTEVYTGTLSVADNMMTVEFTTPYNYQEGNLLVGFKLNSTGSNGTSSSWVGSTGNATGVSMYSYYSGSPSSSNFLPKMKVEYLPGEMPTCWQPQNMEASDVTNEGATLTWQRHAHGEETAWVLQYGTDNTFTTNTTTVNVNTNPTYTIVSGLAASTTYYVRVKPACDNDGNLWSEVIDFETGAACMVPNQIAVSDVTAHEATLTWNGNNDKFIVERGAYNNSGTPTAVTVMNEGFEGGSMPEGWSRTGNYWQITSGTGYGSSYSGSATGNYNAACYIGAYSVSDILVTPAMNLGSYASATLDFNFWNTSWGGDINVLNVYYRVDGGAWNLLYTNSQNNSGWAAVPTITLEGLANNYQIGFECESNYSYGMGIDDIVIEAEEYPVVWTVVDDNVPQSGNAGTFTFENLDPETTYFARVSGRCGSDVSDPSETVSFTTTIACPAPTNLQYVSSTLTAHGVDLTWDVNGNPTTDYKLYLNGEESNIVVNILEGVATYNLAGLDGETEYTVKVKANCGSLDGFSAESNEETFTTEISCYTPTDLVMDDHTTESITVDWTNGSAGQEKWEVAYKEAESTGDFYVITNVSEKPYTIGGLSDGTTYTIKVRANCGNEDGFSLWSTPISEQTVASCATPVNVAVTDESETAHGATLTWEGTADNFNVEVSGLATATVLDEGFEGGSLPAGWTLSATGSANWSVSTSVCNGVSPYGGSNYAAGNPTGTSSRTDEMYIITPAMDLSGAASATLHFYYYQKNWSSDTDPFGVYYRVGTTDTWHQLFYSTSSTSSWTEKTIELEGLAADYQIGFYRKDNYAYGAAIDNVTVTATTPGAWTVDGTANNVANTGTYTFTTLDPETTYFARVKGNCGGVLSPASNVVFFTTLVACQIPTDLTNDTPEPFSVELSWTENGTADKWELCVDGDEENLVTVTSEDVDIEGSVVSHLLEGLSDDADHTVKVRANCGTEGASGWSNTVNFHTPVACPAPTNVEVDNITKNSAEVSWEGDAAGYTVRYRTAPAAVVFEDFESGLGNWTLLTLAEGSGWQYTDITSSSMEAISGVNVAIARSYDGNGNDFSANDWMISSAVTIPDEMSFWYKGDESFPETFYVCVSTTGFDPDDFTVVATYTSNPASWEQEIVDLSAYAGQEGYIAFHHVQYGGNYLLIDDIAFISSDANPWITEADVTSPYTIPGLDPETLYQVQVQSNCSSIFGNSKWVTVPFTTAIACQAPTDLAVPTTGIGTTQAVLTWTNNDDASAWQVCVNGDETHPVNVAYEEVETEGNTISYTLGGLTAETDYTVKVRAVCGGLYGSSAWCDEVEFTSADACPVPVVSPVANITAHTAQVVWSSQVENDANSVVYYRTAPYFVSAFSEQFNSSSIPTGWTRSSTALNDDVLNGTTSLNSYSGGWSNTSYGLGQYNWKMNIYSTGKYWMVTPSIDVPDGGMLEFDVALTAYNSSSAPSSDKMPDANSRFVVLVSDDAMATWTILREWNNTGSPYVLNEISNSGTHVSSIDLSAYAGNSVNIAFYGGQTASGPDCDLHIDNVSVGAMAPAGPWMEEPVASGNSKTLDNLAAETEYELYVKGYCKDNEVESTSETVTFTTNEPCAAPTTLNHGDATTTDVPLTWTKNGAETAWQICINNDMDNLRDVSSADVEIEGNVVSYTLGELTAATNYTVKVRANCGMYGSYNDGESEWSNTTSFQTECNAITTFPWNETFEGFTNSTVPICWDNSTSSSSTISGSYAYYVWGVYYYSSDNNKVMRLYNSMVQNGTALINTPTIELPATGKYALSFDYSHRASCNAFEVKVSTDGTNFTTLGTYSKLNGASNSSSAPGTFTKATISLADYAGESITLQFYAVADYDAGAIFVDNLSIYEVYDFEKPIEANKWYAISSPVNTPTVTSVTNLIATGTDKYDFYRYNEAQGTWENFKASHADFTNFENGRGYIYRNNTGDDLIFTGVPNTGLITYTPTFGCSDVEIKGFNLVGNPYPESAGISYDCYTLNANGTWTIHPSGENYEIGMAEGVMVNVAGTEPIQFTAITTKSAHNAIDGLALSVSGNGYEDVVYARLEDGKGMPKLGHLAAEAPALSIPVEGRNYAIAYVGEEAVSFPLVLNAQSGNYTINTVNSTLPYVHLIDRVAGRDIDLLRQSYTFAADGNSNRFTVLLSPRSLDDAEGDIAIWNGTGWTINGDGTLQVFDVLGRKVYSQEVAEHTTLNTDKLSTGVYVLRMGEKSQKIVVK